MAKSESTILVVGAAGKFAGLVVPELVGRGATVRALVRDEAKASLARSMGASEIAIGDLGDADSLVDACRGVGGVFHIGPAFVANEAAMGVSLVEAAERSGVTKFVFSSVIQPTNIALENHASKIPVEDALYSSRLVYTVLHPANLMQNIGLAWPAIVRDGRFGEPFPSESRVARVDYRDVAELAAVALTGERLDYATLELAAGMYSRHDIVAAIADVLGRPIEAFAPAFDDWVRAARPPYDERQLRMLERVFHHYASCGLGGNSLTLTAALGREPRSLRDYVRDLAGTGRAA